VNRDAIIKPAAVPVQHPTLCYCARPHEGQCSAGSYQSREWTARANQINETKKLAKARTATLKVGKETR